MRSNASEVVEEDELAKAREKPAQGDWSVEAEDGGYRLTLCI